jgi:hypothetical protein
MGGKLCQVNNLMQVPHKSPAPLQSVLNDKPLKQAGLYDRNRSEGIVHDPKNSAQTRAGSRVQRLQCPCVPAVSLEAQFFPWELGAGSTPP